MVMDTDTIGRIGENRFEELCRLAGLECSKPEPDRTGKDRIVEWPVAGEMSLDNRPSPRIAHVQIKSTTNPKGKIKIKLASLEWLIFNDTPAFICSPIVKSCLLYTSPSPRD